MSEDLLPKTHELDYLTRREAQSRAAAAASADSTARIAHETMADSYAERLKRA